MSQLFINENGTTLGVDGNRLSIKYKDGQLRTIPLETLDSVFVMGRVQVSTQCMERLLAKVIPLSYFSKGGRYYGRLVSPGHIRPEIQRLQCSLYDTNFALGFAQKIVDAKIRNLFTIDEDVNYDKQLVLIIYDIIDNKKRTKFSKLKEGYGNRIQKSAFEVNLTKKQYHKLLSDIPGYCGEEDSIRVYKLTSKCQISCWGYKDVTDEDEVIVI